MHIFFFHTGISFGDFIAAGKVLCKGSQQDKATTPATLCVKVKAEYIAKAPPCEKPPRRIRSAGIPPLISCSIMPCINLAAFLIPAVHNYNEKVNILKNKAPSSSSGPPASKAFKSNQLGILNPAFKVTGIVSAVGQTTLTWAGLREAIALAQPCLKIHKTNILYSGQHGPPSNFNYICMNNQINTFISSQN